MVNCWVEKLTVEGDVAHRARPCRSAGAREGLGWNIAGAGSSVLTGIGIARIYKVATKSVFK